MWRAAKAVIYQGSANQGPGQARCSRPTLWMPAPISAGAAMPLVFVHGVATRRDPDYERGVAARNAMFRRYVYPALGWDDRLDPFNAYWGGEAESSAGTMHRCPGRMWRPSVPPRRPRICSLLRQREAGLSIPMRR